MNEEELLRRLAAPLSPWVRLRGALVLVAGLSGAAFIGTLWATEPVPLPGRTQAAFAALILLGLVWAGYGTWAITRKAPLYALDRVIAGWIALTAATLTTLTTTAIAITRASPPALAASLATGALLIATAALLTTRAHRHRTTLLHRRRALEGP